MDLITNSILKMNKNTLDQKNKD